MRSRNNVLAIESLIVMLVLILFAYVVFLVVGAGTGAYRSIIDEKQNTESARVAYSYINMKIKQNDAACEISVVQTTFGNTLKIGASDSDLSTYIFFSDGALYECIAQQDTGPAVDAANKITNMSGFNIYDRDGAVHIQCVIENNGDKQVIEGMVSLRT